MTDETLHSPEPHEEQREGVLVFNERRYAVGLVWLTADSEAEAGLVKDRARRLKADFSCLRSTIVNQQAFGFLKLGHRVGMTSAASIVAEILVGEWHGIFAADNGWWYIAVHSDAIAPDGDRFFFSEEDAYNFFIQRAEEYKWPRCYAPAAWNLPDTNGEIPLDRLLEDSSVGSLLKPANLDALFGGSKKKKIAIVGAGVFLAVIFIAALIPSFFSGIKSQVNTAPVTIVVNTSDIIKPPPPEPSHETPGEMTFLTLRIPKPSALMAKCAGGFDDIARPIPGWQMDSMLCDGLQAGANWRMTSGSIQALRDSANAFPEKSTRSFSGTNRFSVALPLGSVADIVETVSILKEDQIIPVLMQRFEGVGTIQVKRVVPPLERQQGRRGRSAAQAEEPRQAPPFLQVVFVSESPPSVIATYFDLPGLKLQNIAWSVVTKLWTYQAQILIDSEQLRNAQGTP